MQLFQQGDDDYMAGSRELSQLPDLNGGNQPLRSKWRHANNDGTKWSEARVAFESRLDGPDDQ
jgi:hypothetical protein